MLRELFDDWDNDAIWSELSQHSASEQREKQTQAVQKKPQFLPWTLARTSVAIQSRPVLLTSIRITSTGLSPGGRSSPRLPLQNSRFVPQHNVSG